MKKIVTGALLALTLAVAPASGAWAIHEDQPISPDTSDVQLAETGAGDRALIGLGVVGGVLLVGGGAVMAVLTGRSRTR